MVGVLCLEDLVQDLGQRVAILCATGHGIKAGIICELIVLRALKQQMPELVGHTHDKDPAVAGFVELDGRIVGVRRARHAAGLDAVVQVPGAGISQLMQCHIEQADIHVASALVGSR